ncbi:carboxymuconolactone decarboxylase [Actibacterium mucosum KCTC 23349]|uniref:Carboxymuconolactone decarboxylase n=1 Tax=Actibacterium mucosum KCTC 23349 TaxID=1454373 RepID=A0A037ZI81_9RHOB|nr:carboxymuconolactone decarboxylase family protein [Actibacterium mucosum]KAJ54515.1 carboxymuconolactone decarboxylase [Actibacterium mucosum KCTC 23349]
MTDFTLHTAETAPAAAKPLLEKSVKDFGFVPNLHAAMADSPQLLQAYQQVHELFLASSFDAEEKTVVWQTINVEHNCHYCVPAHTGVAHSMKVDAALTDALRDNAPLGNARLEALRSFTLKVVRERGVVSDADVAEFLAAGFTKANVLDVVLGLSQKVMSNYVNHLAHTPVDKVFEKFAWEKKVAEPA